MESPRLELIIDDDPAIPAEEVLQAFEDDDKNQHWFFEHAGELFEEYGAAWVAIHDQKVIKHSRYLDDLLEDLQGDEETTDVCWKVLIERLYRPAST